MTKMQRKENTPMETIIFNGQNLTFDLLVKVATADPLSLKFEIDPAARKKMQASRDYVEKIVKTGKPVYGINTGFGALANKQISQEHLTELQYNLIRSHCTGVGKPFSRALTRAIMCLRANCLMAGHSGVGFSPVELILDFLHFGVHPVIPEKGSVGASGDLAPLAHLSLALIGEGEVEYLGNIIPAQEALKAIERSPAVLGPKDGLSLINGTAVMTALGSLALHEARNLAKLADITGAMTLEALRGSSAPFYEGIHRLKPHPGQKDCAENLTRLLQDSAILSSHQDCHRVQDPYSLRCMPQVHGAIRQTLKQAEEVLGAELNSVTDNPLIFVEEQKVLSGGNFHGEALALAMDYLSMGLAELCNISERRVEKLMNPTFSELPAFLTQSSGLHSGLMIAHVTAAALASENKYLCHPASVDSIPTSTDKEDHVSMGVTSGLKLQTILQNLKYCLSIELLCATQGLEFLKPLASSKPLQGAYEVIRKHVPPIVADRVFAKDIEQILRLVEGGDILRQVELIIGELR